MKLTACKTTTTTIYYIQKSYRTDSGKSSTKTVERLGTMEELEARFGKENTLEAAKAYVKSLTLKEKEEVREVSVKLSPAVRLPMDEQNCFNGGYLFLQKVYHELGIDRICDKIQEKHSFMYNLNEIMKGLIYTRIMYPGSKRSSLEDAKRFIEQPQYDLHQVYRSLSVMAEEMDFIQARLYKNSLALGERRTRVVYYDCTNYFFETEMEEGLRQYGHSKESRPNPIVQLGLFVDMDGIPLAFCINPGNTAETTTLKPLEQKLMADFGMEQLVVCTDAALSSGDNRYFNDGSGRAYITVQSLKTLKEDLQEWSLSPEGWKIKGDKDNNLYDISKIDEDGCLETVFYKDRWINEEVNVKLTTEKGEPIVNSKGKQKTKKVSLSQHLIVTYSVKYKRYLRSLRDRQIERAAAKIEKGASAVEKTSQNSPSRFISRVSATQDGELAQFTSYELNREMIEQEERFDGFYGICTNVKDNPVDVMRFNSLRWTVEDGFRVTKTDFDARPVYVRRDDRIKAHFITCVLALTVLRYLEKKINKGSMNFSTGSIISTLADMNFASIPGEGYMPVYKRTALTNSLHATADFITDTQVVTKRTMRSIISSTKTGKVRKKSKKM